MSKGLFRSSADGIAGLFVSAASTIREAASDELGRLWARLFVDGAAVSAANPLPVTVSGSVTAASVDGTHAHDTPDVGPNNDPVKTGSHATSGLRPAVSEGDWCDDSSTLRGQKRVQPGGPAGDQTIESVAGVIGAVSVPTGNVADDTPDSRNPVKIGGRAQDPTALPAAAAVNDRRDIMTSLQGEVLAYLTRLIAGEDLTNNVLATVVEPLGSATAHAAARAFTAAVAAMQLFVKGSGGRLYQVRATNLSGGLLYLGIVNKAIAVVNGDAFAEVPIPVPAGGFASISYENLGLPLASGIQIAWSSTTASITLAAGGPISALHGTP